MRFDSVSKFRCRAVCRCVLCVTAAVLLLVCSSRVMQAAHYGDMVISQWSRPRLRSRNADSCTL